MILTRCAKTQSATYGVLKAEGEAPFAVTLELPWRENAHDVSCIPAGDYVCKRVISPKFGETFEITGVDGRENILFHKGNTATDTHGCVLIGESFATLGDGPGIGDSKHGFDEFMREMFGLNQFHLEIKTV